jgi:hypothetical protein
MFSPQSPSRTSNDAASNNNSQMNSSVSFTQNLLGSLFLVRQLFAYYANWRYASRVFDEKLDFPLDATVEKNSIPLKQSPENAQ